MFNLQFLSRIRNAEFESTLRHLASGSSLLEVGGGTGEQAALFQRAGFKVISIDLPESNYTKDRCFPVIDYDGKSFPVPDNSVDIVFSSNVLEHIADLQKTHEETKRVLKSEGYAVHIMPSHVWRLATTVTHYCDLALRLCREMVNALPRNSNLKASAQRFAGQIKVAAATVKWGAIPPRHGERGTVWNEEKYFHPRWWKAHFQENNFEVVRVEPLGMFYTGHMLFGARISVTARRQLAHLLGSACYLYVVKPARL